MGLLVLGLVVFRGFEMPERVRFGGKQCLAVHALPGGGRVVDAMGADEGAVSWSGVFSGPFAGERVRLLEGMRRAGAVLPLSWQGWRYSVVIESFRAEAMNPAWVPYRLEACVVAVGDLTATEELPQAPSAADAAALGAGPTLAGDIVDATAGLQSGDVRVAIGAAGTLARLVTAQAYMGIAR